MTTWMATVIVIVWWIGSAAVILKTQKKINWSSGWGTVSVIGLAILSYVLIVMIPIWFLAQVFVANSN